MPFHSDVTDAQSVCLCFMLSLLKNILGEKKSFLPRVRGAHFQAPSKKNVESMIGVKLWLWFITFIGEIDVWGQTNQI